ncbi:glycosyl transferase, partial [Thioclava sp. BHET1]
ALAAELPPGAELVRFLPDFAAQLAASRLSISQAGYNTVCDALVAGCRALLLPFAAGGETEQTERAERLQALGLARMLQEAEATGPRLAALVAEMLAGPAPEAHRLNLDGARGTARVLRALL